MELAMVASTLQPGDERGALHDAVVMRTSTLLTAESLAPDAVVQLRDSLVTTVGTAAVPGELAKAFDGIAGRATDTLRAISEVGPVAAPAGELASLGLTSLGAHGTSAALRAFGLLA